MMFLLGRSQSKSEVEIFRLHGAIYTQPSQYNFKRLEASSTDPQPLHSRTLPVSARAAFLSKRRACRISPQKPADPACTSPGSLPKGDQQDDFTDIDLAGIEGRNIEILANNYMRETDSKCGCFDFIFKRKGTSESYTSEQTSNSVSLSQRMKVFFGIVLPCFSCRLSIGGM